VLLRFAVFDPSLADDHGAKLQWNFCPALLQQLDLDRDFNLRGIVARRCLDR
jgi:hypothetical protein